MVSPLALKAGTEFDGQQGLRTKVMTRGVAFGQAHDSRELMPSTTPKILVCTEGGCSPLVALFWTG